MYEKRQTLIADFAIRGRLAYLSHQETLTLFQRALLRAGVPIVFSGGFNPRPRLSIPLPRSVGTQSRAERFCAVLKSDEPFDAAEIECRLSVQLPTGCELLEVSIAEGKIIFHPMGVQYQFILAEIPGPEWMRYFQTCQDDLSAGRSIEVQRWRVKQKKHQRFDISPFVQQLGLSDNRIDVFCRISQQGSVRIDELMQWLQLKTDELKEPVIRTAVQWNGN